MSFVQVLWFYILWHYTNAWKDIFRIAQNYLWFVSNFFSISLLLKTFFSPWKRLSIHGGRGSEDSLLGALLVNTIMRFVGFFVRLFTIIAGLLSLIITLTIILIFVVIWVLLPAIIFFLFFGGWGMIFTAFLK